MSWRERLRQASFRGAPFHVDTTDHAGGRIVQSHRFPLVDGSFPEDLGAGSAEFTIKGYVIGPDYDRDRDDLEAALSMPGPGPLVHPTRGQIMVQAHRFRVTEDRRQGGMATFEMRFERVARGPSPRVNPDTGTGVEEMADILGQVADDRFTREFALDGLPDWARELAFEGITGPLEGLGAALTRVAGLDLAAFTREFAGFEDLSALLDPLSSLKAVMTTLGRNVPAAEMESLLSDDFVPNLQPPSGGQTVSGGVSGPLPPLRARANAARDTGFDRWRAAFLAERARASARRRFSSAEEAASLRRSLTTDLDREAVNAADAGARDTHRAMTALAAAVTADMTTRAVDLPHLVDVDAGAGPVLALSQRLYQTGARAGEIRAMAPHFHPGFHPGRGRLLAR